MSAPIPFELPLKASDAASLADVTMQVLENRRPQDDLRNRLAARSSALNLTSIRPYWGSLQADPVHANSFYVAVDGLGAGQVAARPQPLLLRIALASAPASGLFPGSTLIGRMRPGNGTRELVVNAVPFGPRDIEAIDIYAAQVDRAFLPRPQGSAPSVTGVTRNPEHEAPQLFEGFRLVMKSTGLNVASIAAAPGTGTRTLAAAVWSAIRAGWRHGFNVESEPLDRASAVEAARVQASFTRFRMQLTSAAVAGGEVPADKLGWALDDFGRRFAVGDHSYTFDPDEVRLLTGRFGPALIDALAVQDVVRAERAAAGLGRAFDLEVVLPPEAAGDRRALLFCLHWLKAHGRPAQQVAIGLPAVDEARELASIARHFGATLSFDSGVLADLPNPAQWTGGRWNCRIEGELSADRVVSTVAALRS